MKKFEGIFRYSQLVQEIDDSDTSILSNITTLKIRKNFTTTTSSAKTYNIYFRNACIIILIQVILRRFGGILSSTGFKIVGNDKKCF